jgi:hypothetical protein
LQIKTETVSPVPFSFLSLITPVRVREKVGRILPVVINRWPVPGPEDELYATLQFVKPGSTASLWDFGQVT